MTRRATISAFVILGAAILGAGYWYVTHASKAAPGAVRTAGGPPVTVSHPLVKDVVEWDEFTGQFSAVEYVELRARVSGYLTEIHFTDGQFVKKGDLLFVIDPRPFQADLAQAEANLERDRAQLVRANLDLKRYADLARKDFASQQQFEQARATAESAAATVRADEAAVAQAKLNVEFTQITAPVSGRISAHEVSVGNLVIGGSTNNTTLLTTIVSLDPIYLLFDMSESDYLSYERAYLQGEIKSTRDKSIPVQARLTDEKQFVHEGRLNFVDNQIVRSSGTIRVRGVFPNPDLLITPGQFARLRIPGSPSHQAILIPDAAIANDQSRKIVMTVKDDGTVLPKVIRPGPSYQGLRIVRQGLDPSDVIIINGLIRARPGAKVTPKPGEIRLDPQAY